MMFATGSSPDHPGRVYAARGLAGLPVILVYVQQRSMLFELWLPRVGSMFFVATAAATLMLWLTWITQRGAHRELWALTWAQAEAENRAIAEAARADAEAAMREGQRLEALGQIAAGVAHDFRNVVQAVQAGAKLIQRAAAQGQTARVHDLAEMLNDAAGRGADLTKKMLDIARNQSGADAPATESNPAQIVQGACSLLARTLGAKCDVRWHTADDLPALVRARAAEFEAALINLAVNARDAMPDGGLISIDAAGRHDPPGLSPGHYARIAVSDNGVGMDADTLARATQAFFTTKGEGKGTGLGLATARAFAVESGGSLEIDSQPGHGTTVTIWLPAA